MENELKHHGIIGMKWGIRRTPAQLGKGKGSANTDEKEKKIAKTDKKAEGEKTKQSIFKKKEKPVEKKTVDELTDDELKAKINRLDLEKRYKDLSAAVNPPKSTRGKDFTMRVLEKIGENTFVNIGTQAANKALGTLINKAFGVESSDTVNRIVNPNKGQSDKK